MTRAVRYAVVPVTAARAARIRETYTPQANRDALRLRDERARKADAALAALSRNLNPTQADADAIARGLARVTRKD